MSRVVSLGKFAPQDESWKSVLKEQTGVLQFVWTGLVFGPLLFSGVVVSLVQSGNFPAGETAPILAYTGTGFAFLAVLLRAFVPDWVAGFGLRSVADGTWDERQAGGTFANPCGARLVERTGDAGRLMLVYTIRTVVAMAVLESGCLMNLVFYLLEQQALSLGVAGGLLTILAIGFPIHERAIAWVEPQLQALQEQGHTES